MFGRKEKLARSEAARVEKQGFKEPGPILGDQGELLVYGENPEGWIETLQGEVLETIYGMEDGSFNEPSMELVNQKLDTLEAFNEPDVSDGVKKLRDYITDSDKFVQDVDDIADLDMTDEEVFKDMQERPLIKMLNSLMESDDIQGVIDNVTNKEKPMGQLVHARALSELSNISARLTDGQREQLGEYISSYKRVAAIKISSVIGAALAGAVVAAPTITHAVTEKAVSSHYEQILDQQELDKLTSMGESYEAGKRDMAHKFHVEGLDRNDGVIRLQVADPDVSVSLPRGVFSESGNRDSNKLSVEYNDETGYVEIKLLEDKWSHYEIRNGIDPDRAYLWREQAILSRISSLLDQPTRNEQGEIIAETGFVPSSLEQMEQSSDLEKTKYMGMIQDADLSKSVESTTLLRHRYNSGAEKERTYGAVFNTVEDAERAVGSGAAFLQAMSFDDVKAISFAEGIQGEEALDFYLRVGGERLLNTFTTFAKVKNSEGRDETSSAATFVHIVGTAATRVNNFNTRLGMDTPSYDELHQGFIDLDPETTYYTLYSHAFSSYVDAYSNCSDRNKEKLDHMYQYLNSGDSGLEKADTATAEFISNFHQQRLLSDHYQANFTRTALNEYLSTIDVTYDLIDGIRVTLAGTDIPVPENHYVEYLDQRIKGLSPDIVQPDLDQYVRRGQGHLNNETRYARKDTVTTSFQMDSDTGILKLTPISGSAGSTEIRTVP